LELLPAGAQRELRYLPASQRVSEERWYLGTADAVYQNIDIIEAYAPKFIVLLAGDHVYKMDYERLLQQHVDDDADVTVGCIEIARQDATGFGVMQIDDNNRIISFLEKPADPPGMPGKPDRALASMGIYVFNTGFLFEQLRRDNADPNSSHDFGKDIIPRLVVEAKAVAHHFAPPACAPRRKRPPIGAMSAPSILFRGQYRSHDVVPDLDLYDQEWPIWTYGEVTAPAKFVHDEIGRRGMAVSSLGLRRLHHLRRQHPPYAAVHRGQRSIPIHAPRSRRGPALCGGGPGRAAVECHHRPRREDPRGAHRRRGSGLERNASAAPIGASASSPRP
jgi:ADP-glucose pyrophosphorylase